MVAEDNANVFINCPFDRSYKPIFDAVVFAIFDCGFVARSTLEIINTAKVRVDMIVQIMEDCRFGYHDISRTGLDTANRLPRFNMPFELGLFLGLARHDGERNVLVVDRDRYRYQKFISDISGQDIKAHDNTPQKAVQVVSQWLRSSQTKADVPGGTHIWKRYRHFRRTLPGLCDELRLQPSELIFNDYTTIVGEWLQENQAF